MKKNGLLLSGGMDSAAIACWRSPDVAFTIDYGQLAASAEIEAAAAICNALRIQHEIIRVDCRSLGSGDMTGSSVHQLAPASDWWPYRNQLLITLVAMRAIALDVGCIWIGTVKSDEVHKDGTAEFVSVLNQLMLLQEGELSIEAPAIAFSTVELVRVSGISEGLLSWSHSCHKANTPCGHCRGCNKFEQTWRALGRDLG